MYLVYFHGFGVRIGVSIFLEMETVAVRSAESKRSSSCAFADKVAQLSVDFFRQHCPAQLMHSYQQTVIATIVIYRRSSTGNELSVVSMGVGTKVAPYELVASQKSLEKGSTIIRDSHAEILARRGFLRYLHSQLRIAVKQEGNSVFDRTPGGSLTRKYELKPGVTFHLYTSSQPCGNASIKRWAKSVTTIYQALGEWEFPSEAHGKIQVTDLGRREGQTALLVKRNRHGQENSSDLQQPDKLRNDVESGGCVDASVATPHLPAGTALPSSQLGNVMTCSDKIARWNAVGLQGSLLSALVEPLYLSTITVGRKFSKVHCERALCCRLQDFCYPEQEEQALVRKRKKKTARLLQSDQQMAVPDKNVHTEECLECGSDTLPHSGTQDAISKSVFRVHHPVMLGTAVKLDEGSIVTSLPSLATAPTDYPPTTDKATDATSMESVVAGARFTDPRCLCCYLNADAQAEGQGGELVLEVIDGRSGLLVGPLERPTSCSYGVGDGSSYSSAGPLIGAGAASEARVSSVCSAQLLKSFTDIWQQLQHDEGTRGRISGEHGKHSLCYSDYKRAVACPEYIAAADLLRSDLRLFGHWIVK